MIDRSSTIAACVQSTERIIFNYENCENLDERDSYPVFSGRIFLDTIRTEMFTDRIFEEPRLEIRIRIEIFWKSQYVIGDIFENSIYLLRSIRNFHIFPTFLMKFISPIFLFDRILNHHVLLSTIRLHNLLHSVQFEHWTLMID